jgi:sugar lactone lactonase YvrE
MNKAGRIISINPKLAIPNGEIVIDCEGFHVGENRDHGVLFDDIPGRVLAASDRRLIVSVPETADSAEVLVHLVSGGERSDAATLTVGRKLVDDIHIVANPAIDPKDGSIIVTRSGGRGQQLPVTLFRIDRDGFVSEIAASVLNPTGIAFDRKGRMFVTNRADGKVLSIERDEEAVEYAGNLGTATGIAFDDDGAMYVGDRAGTIYRVSEFGESETVTTLEPSVAAYHLAFGIDGRLFVTAPGLSSFDSVYAVDPGGFDVKFFKGLGRPQGLAFDNDGNLYVAACLAGRRGIVRIAAAGVKADLMVAGNNVVGLCFGPNGELYVATNQALYVLETGIRGKPL